MTLEQQVVSLELAKKLKELGVKQESYCWWRNDYPNNPGKYTDEWYLISGDNYPYTGKRKSVEYDSGLHLVQAYSVAELGEMLPQNFYTRFDGQGWHGCTYPGFIERKNGDTEKFVVGTAADTEADARAKMLIYLIEAGLYEPMKGTTDAKAA